MGTNWECGLDYPNGIACWFGNIATMCFFIVYIPQFLLNYRRKSVVGFSLQSTVFKLIGSSFLFINSIKNGSGLPVFLYGFLNTIQHCAFLLQFWMYSNSKYCWIYCFIPLFPYYLASVHPNSVRFTDFVKPACQIISHIPQLIQCIKLRSTLGVSMLGQHLNFLGCFLGMIMCYLQSISSFMTWLIYFNSGFQAISLYMVAIWYHEMRFIDYSNRRIRNEVIQNNQPFL